MPSLMKCAGLHTNNNELNLPSGALVQADNVVIDKNDTITPRRGFGAFGDDFPLTTDVSKQLMVYKDRILRHYGTSIQYDSDGAGTFALFNGSYTELETGLRLKYFEANSNFYFTTDDGIKKISASSASDFVTTSGFIVDTGCPKGLDIQASLDYVSSGFLTADNQVGYRIVWGYTDNNNNLIQGTPSERVTISNSSADITTGTITAFADAGGGKVTVTSVGHELETGDKVTILGTTNYNGSFTISGVTANTFDITDGWVADDATGGWTSLNTSTKAITVFADAGGGKVTVTSAAHGLENSDIITITGTISYNGSFTISGVTTDTFEITDTWVANDGVGNWSCPYQVGLISTIPTDCNSTKYFYQLYRTGLSGADGTDPGDEMQLVYEENLTDTDIGLGYINVADENYPESFRENATPLYTNEISGDGILQGNDRPPVAKDITTFRESAFYANTKTLQRRKLTLTSTDNFVAGATKIIIGDDTGTTIYNAETSESLGSNNFELYTTGSASQNIRDTVKSLIKVINRDSSRLVNAYYGSGSEDLPGIIDFEAVSLDDTYIDFAAVGSIGSDFDPTISEAVALTVASVANPTQITAGTHGYSTGDTIYVNCSDSTPVINGTYTITKVDADKFTIPVNVTDIGSAGYVFKQLVYSDNVVAPNRLYFSKTSQPEAVPSTNWMDIGAKDSAILRILPLRDNLFVLKEEGVYIVSGTTAPDFSARLVDSITFAAADTAQVLNNKIFALTNQGVVTISDVGVGIISRQIEDLILGVTNARYTNFSTYSFGVSYESDRAYLLWLPTDTSDTYATQCYRYNIFNHTWTRWEKNCTCGVINPGTDKLYLGDGANDHILQERKNSARSDYCDLEYSTSVSTGGVSSTSIQLDSVANVSVGDALVQTQYISVTNFNRLLRKLDMDPGLTDSDYNSLLAMSAGDSPYSAVSTLFTKLSADDSGKTYTYTSPATFATLKTLYNTMIADLNTAASDSFFGDYESLSDSVEYEGVVIAKATTGNLVTIATATSFIEGEITIHEGYDKTIVWSPQHFGDPAIYKQVREGSILFDGNTFTNATTSFATDFSQSFEEVDFSGAGTGTFGSVSFGGGVFGGSGTDRPFRTLIPLQKQRCRYISCKFEHVNAREVFKIVGISLQFRAYSAKAYRSV